MSEKRSKELIAIESATDVFSRFGYARTTMGDIAAKAGMSRPALYLLFPDKQAAFDRVIAEMDRRTLGEIAAVLRELAPNVQVVLTTGGTGLAKRDVTPEATRDVLEREAPGIAQALRADALHKTPYAALSRGTAGVLGDTLIVNVKVVEGERSRVQAYEGVCIGRHGGGINESFTVRKISYGEGVERVFPVMSPMIDSIKVVRRGKVRRAKLYYLRQLRGKSARIVEKQDRQPAVGE